MINVKLFMYCTSVASLYLCTSAVMINVSLNMKGNFKCGLNTRNGIVYSNPVDIIILNSK